jgi:hypothetical protein
MQKRKLGAAGPEVSIVGLGANNFANRSDFAASERVVNKALDLGITLIDTADSYGNRGGSEEYLGKILGSRRNDIVLATKFGLPMDDTGKMRGASRRYVIQAVEASLRRLKTDWIDLYQVHFPDSRTPIEETLRALDDLINPARCGSSAARIFPQPSSRKRLARRNETTLRRLSPARTNTICSSASWKKTVCRSCAKTASAFCRIFRWRADYSPANTSGMRRYRPARGLPAMCRAARMHFSMRGTGALSKPCRVSPPNAGARCLSSR